MHLNHRRLLADLRQLAKFGRVGSGVHRLAFSLEDREARHWLLQRMTEAGLDARIDGIGNVYGQTKGVTKAVLIGSHTDSVPKGGWLDGAMGVLYGLELARARLETVAQADLAELGIDVISFADEEGTYRALAGSLSFCWFFAVSTEREPACSPERGGVCRPASCHAGSRSACGLSRSPY